MMMIRGRGGATASSRSWTNRLMWTTSWTQTHRMITISNHVVLGDLIEWRAHFYTYTVVVIFRVATRAQTTRSQAQKHRPDHLAKRSRIDGLDLLLGAMMQVVVVKSAATQTAALSRLKVINEPVDGDRRCLGRMRHVAVKVHRPIVQVHLTSLLVEYHIERLLLRLIRRLSLRLLLMLRR